MSCCTRSTCWRTFSMKAQGTFPAVSIAVLMPRRWASASSAAAKVRLEQALAAGERDPAAGFTVEGAVLLDLGHDLVHRHRFAEQVKRFGRTDGHALAAVGAEVPVDPDLEVGIHREDGRLRTFLEAEPALLGADAGTHLVGQLRFGMDALGVAAPLAAKRAAFEEHRRPHPWPVVDREMLDVEDGPRQRLLAAGWTAHRFTSISPREIPSERAICTNTLSAGTVRTLLIASASGTNFKSGG